MPNEYAQITIRTTKEEHKQIKAMAKKADLTMNQFLVDTIFKNIDTIEDTNNGSTDTTNNSEVIEVLQQRIISDEEQLRNKDKQIETLHNLLSREQHLHLKSKEDNEHLRLEIKAEDKTVEKDNTDNRGFFSRLFNL